MTDDYSLSVFSYCKKFTFLKVLTHHFFGVTANFLWCISTFSINVTLLLSQVQLLSRPVQWLKKHQAFVFECLKTSVVLSSQKQENSHFCKKHTVYVATIKVTTKVNKEVSVKQRQGIRIALHFGPICYCRLITGIITLKGSAAASYCINYIKHFRNPEINSCETRWSNSSSCFRTGVSSLKHTFLV